MDLVYLRGGNSSLRFRGSFTVLEGSRNVCEASTADIFSVEDSCDACSPGATEWKDVRGCVSYRTLTGTRKRVVGHCTVIAIARPPSSPYGPDRSCHPTAPPPAKPQTHVWPAEGLDVTLHVQDSQRPG